MSVILYGYKYSVYTRIVKFALAEKELQYIHIEVDPFDEEIEESYLKIHPFRKVPAIIHDGFSIYETRAINQYIDDRFDGIQLQPTDAPSTARMTQIIAIVDAYCYWPMVRQVFSNRVFAAKTGEHVDEGAVQSGLQKSKLALDALTDLIDRDAYLCGSSISLADIHLAPMIDYFQEAPEGKSLLSRYIAVAKWWELIQQNSSFISTRSCLATLSMPDRVGE